MLPRRRCFLLWGCYGSASCVATNLITRPDVGFHVCWREKTQPNLFLRLKCGCATLCASVPGWTDGRMIGIGVVREVGAALCIVSPPRARQAFPALRRTRSTQRSLS